MASHGGGGEPSTAPQPDRWYTLRLGSSFKEDRPASKFCTLRYEFQPASIDKSQSGSLHKSKDNRITVEFQNNQPGKPKVTFEGTSEDYKDNDGVLFFDGETLRLERLHRAVKRLRHVRKPGESGTASCSSAAVNSAAPPAVGVESRSPPLSKASKSQPLSKSMVHSVPLEVERIDIGEPDGPASKSSGKAAEEKEIISAPPNPPPPQASPDRKSVDQEETVDIEVDDDDEDAVAGGEAAAALGPSGGELPERSDSDDEIADVDVSDDDRGRGPNAAEALRAQVNAGEDEPATSSSSGSSGSGSGSSDSDSDGSDDNSSSSGGDVDIDIDGEEA